MYAWVLWMSVYIQFIITMFNFPWSLCSICLLPYLAISFTQQLPAFLRFGRQNAKFNYPGTYVPLESNMSDWADIIFMQQKEEPKAQSHWPIFFNIFTFRLLIQRVRFLPFSWIFRFLYNVILWLFTIAKPILVIHNNHIFR